MQTPKRKRYQKDAAPADDIITLIHLVRQNPALYNYKLQPNQRRRIDVLNGWSNIAAQIGNKYTVEECRRKWKNLRDTYHQYRLRKPKLGDGLAKWRYAKDLEFLSNVYQPKLKSHRQTHYNHNATHTHLHEASSGVAHDPTVVASGGNSIVHHGSSITLVNDDEAFILTTYEDGDDVATIDGRHEDPNMSQMELSHHDNDVEDVEEIVKHEHDPSLDDDGATGAEVDYEEVCMYEEATGNVDCETTIIGASASGVGRSTSTDSSKEVFQYIDTHDFCIESINPTHTPLSNTSTTTASVIGSSSKLKNVGLVSTSPASLLATTPAPAFSATSSATIASPIVQMQAPISAVQTRDELDLFFEFLKKKMQLFPKEEITAMQVEFLNCVMRREALSANAQKNNSLAQ